MCDDVFTDLDSLIAHKVSHTDRKPHLCNMCGEAFTHLDSLITHKEKHKDQHIFVCVVCNNIFTSEEDIDKHLETHNMSNTLNSDESRDASQTSEFVPRKFDGEMHEELTHSIIKTEQGMENSVKQKMTTKPRLGTEGFASSSASHKGLVVKIFQEDQIIN